MVSGWALFWFLAWVPLLAIAGCSHYGFSNQSGAASSQNGAGQLAHDGMAVWTVATPADEGLDAAMLTRALAGSIRRSGVDASWRADASRVSVRCSVEQTEVRGFEQALFASAQVACNVGQSGEASEQFTALGRYVASSTGSASALVETYAELQQAAATDAIEQLAEQIARWRLSVSTPSPFSTK